MARIRPGRAVPPRPWPDGARLDEAGLGADSLDRLKLATSLGEAIHLHAGGSGDTLLAAPTIGAWVDTAAISLANFSAELTFRTSGSSGEPKWCVHFLTELEAEIDIIAARLRGCRRVIAVVPSHHIYGFLFTLLLPARLGVPVVDARVSSPAGVASQLRAGDLVVGHPDFWAAFVRTAAPVPADVRGVTSTAPCPPVVARAVAGAGIALLEVYGSSETAGIGWRDDPAAAYELFAYWRRGPSDADLIRTQLDGSERVVRTPDRLAWVDARHLRPAGRREGAVMVGGHNVFPERIRDVLCEHPGVAAAAVRLMRPDEGDRLKAFVVPVPGVHDEATLRERLWGWVAERLTPAERPTSITFGPALPAGALGKHADWPVIAE